MNDDTGASPRLMTWHKLVLPIVSIVVFFGVAEFVLWIGGVKPLSNDRDPFVGFADYAPLFERRTDGAGREVFETAPGKLRFFNQQRFEATKQTGVRRIFCVGGSTTYGRPYDDRTSFAGWLRELLPVVDPDEHWEVVNAGGISYASYRVARVMEELVAYEPDLFVVYTGHNEFLEERSYGNLRRIPPLVRAASSLATRSRTATVLHHALDALGLVRDEARSGRALVKSEVDPMLERFSGLDAYERDDALRDSIVMHYESSLARMIEIARGAGAAIVFVTPASNLKDCSPFKAQPSEALDESELRELRSVIEDARSSIRAGRGAEALPRIEDALADDPRDADLQYLRGTILLAEGRTDEASEALRVSRDEDVCPLRALTAMQSAVRRTATEYDVPVVDFVDLVSRESARITGNRIPGAELFLDHVHPTIDSHRLLAFALVDELVTLGIVERRTGWSEPEIGRVSAEIHERVDAREQARALGNLAQVLRWAGKADEARALAERSLALGTEDAQATLTASRALADAATREGRFDEALVHIRRALAQNPSSSRTHFQYGLMYLNESTREIERSAAHLFLATALDGAPALTHQTLGLAMAERGQYELAYRFLRAAANLDPEDPDTRSALERLHGMLGEAVTEIPPAEVIVDGRRGPVPEAVGQVIRRTDGALVRDGIWTEWHENGEPRRFLTYVAAIPRGTEVTWNSAGEETSRIEHQP